jgi:glycerol-3-phosphate cytidylyltransferase-like family protein
METKPKKKKIILIQGAYDIMNWGHDKSFELIKKTYPGCYLIVALNSNKLIKKYKKRDAVLPWYQKKFMLECKRYVDKVVKATEFSPLELLKKYNVDVYVFTKEWENTKKKEIAYMKKKGGEVFISPRFKGVVATSDIKRTLLKEAQDGFME